MVCPEDKAEQEAAWRPASHYEEFKVSLEKEIFPVKETKQIVNDVNIPQAISIKEEAVSSQDLPPLEDTETESSSPDMKETGFSFNEVMNELSPKDEKNSKEEFEDIEDHTFRIANKEDNLLEDLPAQSLFAPDDSNQGQQPAAEDTGDKPGALPFNQEINGIQATNNVQGNQKDFLEISNNKIISSSDGRVKKRKPNDLLFILSFIVLTVVAIALCMAFWNMMKEDKFGPNNDAAQTRGQAKLDDEEEETSMVSEIANQPAEPEINFPAETLQQPLTLEDQVINIVKDTQLAGKGKTIGEYLQSVYGKDYQYSWSAKPFTDKVYIVEFFASQVRSEPFVYLFRVDTDQKKITGALNNITLDLIS